MAIDVLVVQEFLNRAEKFSSTTGDATVWQLPPFPRPHNKGCWETTCSAHTPAYLMEEIGRAEKVRQRFLTNTTDLVRHYVGVVPL
jgi:hypothetical protein